VKIRHLVLAASLAGSAWLAFFADKTPVYEVSEPAQSLPSRRADGVALGHRALLVPRDTASMAASMRVPELHRLQSRAEAVRGNEATVTKIDLFAVTNWSPAPPAQMTPPQPPPPTAPALPFKFIGKKLEAGAWEVYMTREQQLFVATEHAVIDGHYRVESIEPPIMRLTYLPLSQLQDLTIGPTE